MSIGKYIRFAAVAIAFMVMTVPVMAQTSPPVLNPIGPQTVAEGSTLNLPVTATDLDVTIPVLTTSALPPNAAFVDNGNGTGNFSFSPDFTQAGEYFVTFYATDAVTPADVDSEIVAITVTNTNRVPVLDPIGPKSVAEGANLNFNATATDPDGTIPTLSAVGVPTNATFVDNGNGTGTFNFNPDFTQAGLFNVTFIASDGVLADTEIVAVTVTNVNQAPILAAIGPKSVAEGANLNFNTTATDPDGTIPTLSAVGVPANATFVDNGNGTGTFNFNPNFTQAGLFNVTFIASDGALADTEIVAVTVTNVNQAPILAAIGPKSVAEGANLNFNATATDVDGTIPTLSAVGVPANATFVDNGNGSGTFNFNPNFTQAGLFSVTFIASDGVLADTEIVAVTVTNVNQAPILAAIGPKSVAEGANLNFNATATDVDGTIPTLSAVGVPANATFVDNGNGTGTFNFNPNFTQAGLFNVTFIASDGALADTEIVAVTVTNVNQAPILAAIGPRSVAEGANLNFNATATDVDGTIPTLSAVGVPANATFVDNGNGSGTFNFNPNFTQAGLFSVTFIASDGVLADTEIVAVTVTNVNQAPILAAIGPKSVAEGANLNFNATATDVDGTIPTLSAVGVPANATFVDNGNGTGTFNFNPNFTQAGLFSVTFIASDGALADTEIVAITVTNVNQAPILAAIGPKSVAEGANLNFNATATDPDGTIPTLSAVGVPTNATFVDNGNGTGTFNFNPNFTQAGLFSVTFIASDGVLADTEIVAVTVTNVNQAPILAAIGPKSVAEGANLNFNATATDVDGTIPTLSAVGVPANATFVDNGNATGTFNFNPDFTQAGIYNVTFIASDGALADTEIVAITVTDAGNQAPVVTGIPDQTIAEGGTFATITLDNFVTDADNTDAEMTWTFSGNTSLIVSIVGRVATISTPNADWNGAETITFRATDPGLAFGEDAATFTVTAVNDAPVVSDIPDQTVPEGTPFATINLDDYVTDIDNTDAEMTWTYSGNTALTVSIVGRVATITPPNADWDGAETITFRATDPGALFAEDAATFTVTAVNDAPVLAAIGPKTVAEGATLNFGVTATDIDGPTPTLLTAVNVPANGTFVDNGNGTGTFSFMPDFSQLGVYSVTFIASDGLLADTEIVAITVNETNRPPELALIGPQTVIEGQSLVFAVSATDPDGNFPALTISPLANATLVDAGNGTGTFTFNPTFAQAGVHSVTFYASDGFAIDSEIVTITVTDAGNQPPVLNPIGNQAVYENATLNLTVTATDPDGTIPLLSALNLPIGAVFTDNTNGTGSLVFTPDFTQAGVYSVTFKAFDGALVDSEVIAITVLNTNRAPILAAIGQKTVTEGQNLHFAVTATDPDATVPVMTTSILPANAAFADNHNGTGTFDFTPSFNQSGIYTITFYAGDGAATDSEVVSIIVSESGNQAPKIDSIGPRFVTEGAVLDFTMHATDPDGTTPVLAVVNLPANATFVDNLTGAGTFHFTPDFTQAGVYGVSFIASDGVLADTELVLVTVRKMGNVAPILAPIGPQTVLENDTLTINLTATDPNTDSMFFSFTTKRPMTGVSLVDNHNGTAVLTYLPDNFSSGVDTVKIFVTDYGTPRLTDYEDVVITTVEVNQPPVIAPLGPFTAKVGKQLRFAIHAYDSTAAPGDSIFLTASGIPQNATLVDSGNGRGAFFFTPASNQVGVLTVRFIAVDNGIPAMTAFRDVQITVVATNRPPVLAMIGPKLVTEGQTLTFGVSATDPDGTIPALTADAVPTNATFVDNGNGTGTFTFAPSFVQSGLYGVIIHASDGIDSDKETVLIQVVEAGNQRPIFATVGPKETTEAVQLQFKVTATDPDGTKPVITVGALPLGATVFDSGNGSASFTWTPGYFQSGVYDVLFIASDGTLADTELVTITVLDAGNQKPTMQPVTNVATTETKKIKFTVRSGDPDSVVPILSTSPLPGTATFIDNHDYTGTFEWQTGYYDAGTYTITFYATDGGDAALIDSARMQITVADSNQLPFALPEPFVQSQEVNEGATLNFRIAGYDPDSTIPILRINETIPNFVFVDSANGFGILRITPNYQQAGLYNIHFVAKDSDPRYPHDSTVTEAYEFRVINVTVPPVLAPIGPKSVIEGDTLIFQVSATDPNGVTSPSIFAENLPANAGLVGLTSPKSFRFFPSYLQAGVYTVLFRAVAGTLADSEYVTITVVEAGNQPPYFVKNFADTQKVVFGNSIANRIVAIDPELNPVVLTILSPPANVVFVDSTQGIGSMTFTPVAGQVGATYIFRYVATDGAGAADTLNNWIRVMAFMRGDANSDLRINIADVTYIIDYVFRDGPPPELPEAADANFDTFLNVTDALYLVNYIFRQGPPPPVK